MGPAHSGLFDELERPWHIAQPSLCRERADILAGKQDWLYWQTILPNNNRQAGLTLHAKHTNNAVSFWAELTPAVELAMIRNGKTPYIVSEKVLTNAQKDEIVTRMRLRRETLIKAENTLKATAIVAIPIIIGYAFAPSVAALTLKEILTKAASTAGKFKLAKDIVSLDDLSERELLTPIDAKATSIDPRRIGQFFYAETKMARTFSIMTTDGPRKWLVVKTVILGKDIQGEDVLIPLFECLHPMKWERPD